MDIEEKKKAILEATKNFSKSQLDPRGKGRYILSLERNENITEERINEIYKNILRLQKLEDGKENVLDKTLDKTLDKSLDKSLDKKTALQLDKTLDKEIILLDKVRQIEEKMQQLEKTMHELDDMMSLILTKQKGMEERIAQLEEKSLIHEDKPKAKDKDNQQPQSLLGFALVQKKTSTSGKQYLKWYAVKRMDGKQVWIYIGDDISKAEEKIRKWQKKT